MRSSVALRTLTAASGLETGLYMEGPRTSPASVAHSAKVRSPTFLPKYRSAAWAMP